MTLPNFMTLTREQLRPMTDSETRNFMTLCLGGTSDAPQSLSYFDTEFDAEKLPFILRGIVERLRGTDLPYSPKAILLISMLSDRPGTAVMWAYNLFKASRDGTPATLESLIDGPFGFGIPTEETYATMWHAQKNRDAPLGNLLDADDTWRVKTTI